MPACKEPVISYLLERGTVSVAARGLAFFGAGDASRGLRLGLAGFSRVVQGLVMYMNKPPIPGPLNTQAS